MQEPPFDGKGACKQLRRLTEADATRNRVLYVRSRKVALRMDSQGGAASARQTPLKNREGTSGLTTSRAFSHDAQRMRQGTIVAQGEPIREARMNRPNRRTVILNRADGATVVKQRLQKSAT